MAAAARPPLTKLARRYRPGPAFRLSGMDRKPDRDRGGSGARLRFPAFRRRPESGIAQTSFNRRGKAGRRASNGDIYPTLHLASGSADERRLSSAILGCSYRLYSLRRFCREGRPARPGDRARQQCPFGRKGAGGPDAGPVVNGAGGRARTGTLREKRILSPLRLPVSPRPQGVQRWRSAAFGGVSEHPADEAGLVDENVLRRRARGQAGHGHHVAA